MNAYDMNRVLFVAQERGVRRAGLQFTDHDGYIGVVLFLKRGPLAAGRRRAGRRAHFSLIVDGPAHPLRCLSNP
jgi:hypothetical protein